MKIKGLNFVKTCAASPEQYEVFDSVGEHVGYVCLYWGWLTCECPDIGGERVYMVNIGDGLIWEFESQEQRENHLNAIADKIIERIGKNNENI